MSNVTSCQVFDNGKTDYDEDDVIATQLGHQVEADRKDMAGLGNVNSLCMPVIWFPKPSTRESHHANAGNWFRAMYR